MKKLLLLTISIMLLASVAWGQHQMGTISGTVMGQQEGGNVPLRYAHVVAFQGNSEWPMGFANTDSLGQYTLRVPFGQYVVAAGAMNYGRLWYNNVPERSQATVLTVADGQNPAGIDFLLVPQQPPPPPERGTISGVVMGQHDGGTVPLGHANVMAFLPNRDWPVAETMTDSTGNYILRVVVGNYQIRAEARGFAHLWYNNVPERSQATIVAVTDSSNPTGIDFLLPPVEPPPPPPRDARRPRG